MTASSTESVDPACWRRANDVHAMGPAQGSGLRTPTHLYRRADGQVLQVSELLNLVIEEVDPDTPYADTAKAVSDRYGSDLNAEGVEFLLREKLAPLGLVESVDEEPGAERTVLRSVPLLSLSLRGTVVPARVVRFIARALAPAFHPGVVAVMLIGVVALDVTILQRGGLLAAFEQLLAAPALLLALYFLLTAGALIHELGHAAACHYGGAQPGRIGFGVYLVFPAFYTDVTESYRLDRGGRIRTDLGGLYFNVLCLLAAGGAYFATGNGVFLLVVVIMQIEMVQQLIPIVRFDGYYILTDLAGVPDLFARVRPVLRSALPGREVDPRVAELRPGARRIVVTWVILVVPVLYFALGWLIWNLPLVVMRTVAAVQAQLNQAAAAWAHGDLVIASLSVISVAMLSLPLLGLAVLAWRLAAPPVKLLTNLASSRRGDLAEST